MFRGISSVNLDTKGRFAVPTKYREPLMSSDRGRLVITIDTEAACLLMYRLCDWERIERKIQELPSFNPAARRLQRLLIGHATEIEMDGAGRVLVPPILRDYADIDKKMMLVGQGNKFELWDDTHWFEGRERWLEEEAKTPEALPEEMKTLSI